MTAQVKHYIEVSDMLTLKLDCKSCGASLTVPISRDLSPTEEWGKLNICPMCRSPWATVGTNSYQPTLAEFTASLRKLANTLANAPVGFTLGLEIKPPLAEK